MDSDQKRYLKLEQGMVEISGSLADLCQQADLWHPEAAESQRERLIDLLSEMSEFQKELEARLVSSQRKLQFDPVLASVAHDLGQPWLNLLEIRQQHAPSWREALELLQPDYDFDIEVRKLVEQTLLNHESPLPITGRDLIETFNLAPGFCVTELLYQAHVFYKKRPCSAEQLLRRLEPWAVEFGGSPAGSKTVDEEPPPETSLWQEAIAYASAATLFDRVGRKDEVAEGILQQFLRPELLPVLRDALREDDDYRSGGLTLLLFLVANYIKNSKQAIECKGLLGAHPRWTNAIDLRRRLSLLERALARVFSVPFPTQRFRRTHLRGKVSATPGATILVTLSSKLHHLFRHDLILEECFAGPRPVLVVNYDGQDIDALDPSVVGEEWMTIGRLDPESSDVPQLPIVGAASYLPTQLFALRLHEGGFQVKSVSGFILYNAVNAESDILALKTGDIFRIAGLECRLSASQ